MNRSLDVVSFSVRPSARLIARRQLLSRVQCNKTNSPEAESPFRTVRTIQISYTELKDKRKDLSSKIEEGFGPNGLGILSVSQVPGFSSLRQTLLNLSPRIASLPNDVKSMLEDPESRYNIGWSHGKEKLESGKAAFKALGKLMLDVGQMLAYHCDHYVSKALKFNVGECLQQILIRSRCHKGRLLYYFPKQHSGCTAGTDLSSWCGWHTDHGSLTGLTNGMFLKNGVNVGCPDRAAGLYVRTRDNEIVRVVFGEEEVAYQIGEVTEILSQSLLCATPHCVKAPNGEMAVGIDRSTFALFMQPDWDEFLKFPSEIHRHKEFITPNGTLSFGEYSEALLGKYYY
ncbi:hypothetical protein HPP92_003061 [Vanilla planifolia]|uniref:Fe2OG dioxygenase domain-containing protein n=1 Tax=Vanilla planifolia TaxID=51239 RepID=A0A835VJE4_VANPL|nr:hypothetical protein HPP92_003437 [Vanilla planifolia]KAG0502989.1 hypothetical protein HPP92_003061 [Vanilla planifolia]